MMKFPEIGYSVDWLGIKGVVKAIDKEDGSVFIKRDDGESGPAWKNTEYEGLYNIPVDEFLIIISQNLENE